MDLQFTRLAGIDEFSQIGRAFADSSDIAKLRSSEFCIILFFYSKVGIGRDVTKYSNLPILQFERVLTIVVGLYGTTGFVGDACTPSREIDFPIYQFGSVITLTIHSSIIQSKSKVEFFGLVAAQFRDHSLADHKATVGAGIDEVGFVVATGHFANLAGRSTHHALAVSLFNHILETDRQTDGSVHVVFWLIVALQFKLGIGSDLSFQCFGLELHAAVIPCLTSRDSQICSSAGSGFGIVCFIQFNNESEFRLHI